MDITELAKKTKDLAEITTLRKTKVMVRNCVDGNMYEIDLELNLALYKNESIIIIDIHPEME